MNTAVLPVSVALAASVALMATGRTSTQPKVAQLTPTAHAALPNAPSDFWLVPSESDSAARQGTRYEALAEAAKKYQAGDFEGTIQAASRPAVAKTPLAHYATYYVGLAQLRLLRFDEARKTLQGLKGAGPAGHLATASTLEPCPRWTRP